WPYRVRPQIIVVCCFDAAANLLQVDRRDVRQLLQRRATTFRHMNDDPRDSGAGTRDLGPCWGLRLALGFAHQQSLGIAAEPETAWPSDAASHSLRPAAQAASPIVPCLLLRNPSHQHRAELQ